jgi:hypothetical protein
MHGLQIRAIGGNDENIPMFFVFLVFMLFYERTHGLQIRASGLLRQFAVARVQIRASGEI